MPDILKQFKTKSKGVKRSTLPPKDAIRALAEASDEMRHLSEWVEAYLDTTPDVQVAGEFDVQRIRKLRQRIGLIKWCLGVDVHL